jgi:hypothetical protein
VRFNDADCPLITWLYPQGRHRFETGNKIRIKILHAFNCLMIAFIKFSNTLFRKLVRRAPDIRSPAARSSYRRLVAF